MKRSGFTFVEVMISITIFTIIIVTVYSAFNMGMKIWRRTQTDKSLQRIRLAFLKIDKELRNTFFFSGIPFNGSSTEIEFPLSVSDGDKENIYKITYSVDVDEVLEPKALTRKEELYPEDIGEHSKEKILLSSLKSVKFEYTYEPSDPSQDFEWQDSWNENGLPSGIRLSLEAHGSNEIYNKLIFLQQGEFGPK